MCRRACAARWSFRPTSGSTSRTRAVRAHADHRRRGLLCELSRRLHGAQARREPASRRRCRTRRARRRRNQIFDRAELVSGDSEGRGGIYNFVTKRGDCRRNSHISWTQVETGSAITWKYPSCILRGDGSHGEFYSIAVSNGMSRSTAAPRCCISAATRRAASSPRAFRPDVAEHLSRAGIRASQGRRRAQFHPVRHAADRAQLRRADDSLYQ